MATKGKSCETGFRRCEEARLLGGSNDQTVKSEAVGVCTMTGEGRVFKPRGQSLQRLGNKGEPGCAVDGHKYTPAHWGTAIGDVEAEEAGVWQ